MLSLYVAQTIWRIHGADSAVEVLAVEPMRSTVGLLHRNLLRHAAAAGVGLIHHGAGLTGGVYHCAVGYTEHPANPAGLAAAWFPLINAAIQEEDDVTTVVDRTVVGPTKVCACA